MPTRVEVPSGSAVEPEPDPESESFPAPPVDLRMVAIGAAGWGGALLARLGAVALVAVALVAVALAAATAVVVTLGVRRRRARTATGAPSTVRSPALATTLAAAAVVALATGGVTLARHTSTSASPVAELAADGAAVTVVGTVRSDPVAIEGRFGDQTLVRLDVREVVGRGATTALHAPVLVLGGPAWLEVRLGSRVRAVGRLAPADDPSVAGLLLGGATPRVLEPPGAAWRAADAVRGGVRTAVEHRPADQAALVPALVDGDDANLDPALEADFRTTGLTHLTAVSGTNLTLLLGFVLAVAKAVGVRGRWLLLVGLLGVAGFVLLARTEPSVLRAAVMGVVGLLALRADGRRRGPRALGVAVLVLVLLDPELAVSAGFALSVLATAGIVLLAPRLRAALARWCPGWVAEAVAVPLAAQLACTPVVAAISGQVSLVAVAANLLVAPVVGPATVLGLAGGVLAVAIVPLGQVVATPAAWCVGWIIVVAEHGADLPLASIGWGTGAVAVGALTALVLAVLWLAPRVLRRPLIAVPLAVVLLLVCLGVVRSGAPSPLPWARGPPDDWALVACDVGQGDALVLRAGPHAGVVVDVGPDPESVDACLRSLQVTSVPLLVLTHFHADHVDGLAGVLDGRDVSTVWTTSVLDPPSGVDEVETTLRAEPPTDGLDAVGLGTGVSVGEVTLQVLWPRSAGPGATTAGAGDGSSANDASVVLLAEVRGLRVLLTGDVEPPAQEAIEAEVGDPAALDVDVLKVPHHGSAHQDLSLLTALDAETALISVGADNDYGHPAPSLVDALEADGTAVHRTDEEGDLVVTADGEVLGLG